ncbi:MAG: hypothetical protein Fur0028_07100 [Bacteroidales bacterium]
MFSTKKNIFVLAPHTDDGELGAGGTIARLVEAGANVYYAALSTAEKSLPSGMPNDTLVTELKEATKKLGIPESNLFIFHYEVRKLSYYRQEILEELIKIKKQISIDLVLMPCFNDIHQDHATIAQEGIRAFKNTSIIGYELIWNNLSFQTDIFIKLEQQHIEKKIKALSAYQSQQNRSYMTPEFITSLARTRGVQAGCLFAEAFQAIRLIW